ncbi:MAG: patatin-like phospholipase family protein [Candidatus Nitrosocosmicus sp.]
MSKDIQIPDIQNALVLQGGGALGAYEAGAYKAIYEDRIKESVKSNVPLFDIVAGTSSGAINASVLVSYVLKNGWEGSEKHLEEFWRHLSSTPNLSNWWPNSFDDDSWVSVWQERHNMNQNAATGETARRYYSAKEYLYSGAPKVFSKPNLEYDNKFFDEFSPPVNLWYKYNNQPLKESIREFVPVPISTDYLEENKQPRLLLVSVDIQEGTSVVFDSYPKEKETDERYSKYSSDGIDEDNENNIEKITRYNKGIFVDQIIASASVPINYDYTTLMVENHPRDTNVNNKISNNQTTGYFWDGGLLSNSPLRELIQAHRDYWLMKNGISNTQKKPIENKKIDRNYKDLANIQIPDLNLYIVDVHPSRNDNISFDRDGVLNRNIDITYHNRNLYDIKVANIVSDYVDLFNELIDNIEKNDSNDSIINKILSKTTSKSASRSGEDRQYMDLLEGRFAINELHHFERRNDENAISNKAFDFSKQTINQLIEDGYKQTKIRLLEDKRLREEHH